jgi:hypothetical protein
MPRDLMRPVALERMMLRLVTLATDIASVLIPRSSALRGGRVVAQFMASGTLNERWVVARAYKLDLMSEHADTFARGTFVTLR